jgi:hypothetical protein
MLLYWILIKITGESGWDSFGSGKEQMENSWEQSIEPSGSIKGGEFIEQLNDYKLLKKDSAARS